MGDEARVCKAVLACSIQSATPSVSPGRLTYRNSEPFLSAIRYLVLLRDDLMLLTQRVLLLLLSEQCGHGGEEQLLSLLL